MNNFDVFYIGEHQYDANKCFCVCCTKCGKERM